MLAGSKKNKGCEDFFRMMESEAGNFPVDIFKVSENGSLQGFLALESSFSKIKKAEISRALSFAANEGKGNQPLGTPQIALADQDTLKTRLRTELRLVKKSKLPCSLLLVKIDNLKQTEHLKMVMNQLREHIPCNGHLDLFDDETFSLLLPGLNIKRSLRLAEAVRRSLSHRQIRMGLTVCTCRDTQKVDTFVRMAEEELKRAEAEQMEICHSCAEPGHDSCQVTAEERVHLFSFLNVGKK